MTDFCYARLSAHDLGAFRIQGPGLGNLLLPWARSIVAARRYELRLLAPTWPQLKLGALLRREADKRFYSDLFLSPPDQIKGPKKLLLLRSLPRVGEAEFGREKETSLDSDERTLLGERDKRPRLIVFEGQGQPFQEILDDYDLVRRELLAITLEKHTAGLQHDFKRSISMHVRLGDFKTGNLQTSMAWFVAAAQALRAEMGAQTQVFVFSDGSDEELGPLLRLPGAQRLGFGSSIADILALSASQVLVASGGSSFSMWASYLGRMPVMWPATTNYHKLYAHTSQAQTEIEWSQSDILPPNFTQRLHG